jgi:hypothetical protein
VFSDIGTSDRASVREQSLSGPGIGRWFGESRRTSAIPALFQRGIRGLYRADFVLQVSDKESKRSQRVPADPIHRVTLLCVEESFRYRLLVPGGQEHRRPGSIVPMLSLIEQNGDEFVGGETAAFTCCHPSLYGRHSIAAPGV